MYLYMYLHVYVHVHIRVCTYVNMCIHLYHIQPDAMHDAPDARTHELVRIIRVISYHACHTYQVRDAEHASAQNVSKISCMHDTHIHIIPYVSNKPGSRRRARIRPVSDRIPCPTQLDPPRLVAPAGGGRPVPHRRRLRETVRQRLRERLRLGGCPVPHRRRRRGGVA